MHIQTHVDIYLYANEVCTTKYKVAYDKIMRSQRIYIKQINLELKGRPLFRIGVPKLNIILFSRQIFIVHSEGEYTKNSLQQTVSLLDIY